MNTDKPTGPSKNFWRRVGGTSQLAIREQPAALFAWSVMVNGPGALQNPRTIDKMPAGQRFARNSMIVEVLRDYSYADVRGMCYSGAISTGYSFHA